MNRNTLIIIAVVVVVAVVVGVVLAVVPKVETSNQTQSQHVFLPTQTQISSASPGWRIVSLAKFNYSQTLAGVFPGSDAVYQEIAQNGNATLVVWVIHYATAPSFNLTIPHTIYGRYVLAVNVTGNTSPVNLTPFLNQESSAMRSGSGLQVSFPSFLYPQTKELSLASFEVSNLTTPYGNFTQWGEELVGSTTEVQLSVFQGSNASSLYSYFYGATQGGAVNGTINGFNYFNFTTQGFSGASTYMVGIRGNYVVFAQFQGTAQFQVFETILKSL